MLLQRTQWSELSGQCFLTQDSPGTGVENTPQFSSWAGGCVPRAAAAR